MYFLKQSQAVSVRSRLAPAPTGSSSTGWPQALTFTGSQHGRESIAVQCSDIDVPGRTADSGNFLRFLQIIGHNRRTATGQQDVSAVVYGDIICNIVN